MSQSNSSLENPEIPVWKKRLSESGPRKTGLRIAYLDVNSLRCKVHQIEYLAMTWIFFLLPKQDSLSKRKETLLLFLAPSWRKTTTRLSIELMITPKGASWLGICEKRKQLCNC